MRWWRIGGCVIALVGVLAGCGTSDTGGSAAKRPSESPSGRTSAGSPSAPSSVAPSSPAPSGSPTRPTPSATASPPSPSGAGCVAGRAEVTVSPGDPVRRPVCVRPGTVVTLVLSPRTDGKRWTAVRSSAPALVLVSGRQVAADGTAHVSLRAAGTRGGSAEITVSAKEPDVAGTGGVGFTLAVTVTPYAREG